MQIFFLLLSNIFTCCKAGFSVTFSFFLSCTLTHMLKGLPSIFHRSFSHQFLPDSMFLLRKCVATVWSCHPWNAMLRSANLLICNLSFPCLHFASRPGNSRLIIFPNSPTQGMDFRSTSRITLLYLDRGR